MVRRIAGAHKCMCRCVLPAWLREDPVHGGSIPDLEHGEDGNTGLVMVVPGLLQEDVDRPAQEVDPPPDEAFVAEFVDALVERRAPTCDLYQSIAMTAPASAATSFRRSRAGRRSPQ